LMLKQIDFIMIISFDALRSSFLNITNHLGKNTTLQFIGQAQYKDLTVTNDTVWIALVYDTTRIKLVAVDLEDPTTKELDYNNGEDILELKFYQFEDCLFLCTSKLYRVYSNEINLIQSEVRLNSLAIWSNNSMEYIKTGKSICEFYNKFEELKSMIPVDRDFTVIRNNSVLYFFFPIAGGTSYFFLKFLKNYLQRI